MDRDVVLDLYEDVCDYWKEKLRNKYPLYFNKELVEGKVYKFNQVIFQYYPENISVYGIDDFEEFGGIITPQYFIHHSDSCTEVTDNSLLQTFFKREAKRRGYKDGSIYVDSFRKEKVTLVSFDNLYYFGYVENMLTDGHGGAIFRDGKWAEII
jgi:hypothetical protein